MPRRAGLESSRQVRKARKVLITAKVGRAFRASRRTAGRMSGCPVVTMNDDPMKTARGCHPSIIQLDNRASEQRNTLSSVQVCKCPYGMLTFTRKKRLAELVGAQVPSVRLSRPSTV